MFFFISSIFSLKYSEFDSEDKRFKLPIFNARGCPLRFIMSRCCAATSMSLSFSSNWMEIMILATSSKWRCSTTSYSTNQSQYWRECTTGQFVQNCGLLKNVCIEFQTFSFHGTHTLTLIIWLLSIENRDVTSAQRFGYSSILFSVTKTCNAASKSE